MNMDSSVQAADDLVNRTVPDAADMPLERYDAAKRALAAACSIDEVLNIRNLALAAQVYAQQAQDRDLLDRAIDLRMRGERKAGELLRELAGRGERARRGGDRKIKVDDATLKPKTLEDLGVKKHQSVRYQKLAGLRLEEFEDKVEVAKEKAAGIKVKFDRPKSDPDRVRRFINWVASGWEIVQDLADERDDIPDEIRNLTFLVPYAKRLRNEIDQRKAEQKAANKAARQERRKAGREERNAAPSRTKKTPPAPIINAQPAEPPRQ